MASRQDELEARVTEYVRKLSEEFADLGVETRFAVTRGLIHRAVHHAVDASAGPTRVEYCALATYLADMIGHAHKVAHGDNPRAASHKDLVH